MKFTLKLQMKDFINKSCIVNHYKMLNEYTWIRSFCLVKIRHIQKVGGLQSIQERSQATLGFTVGPFWIHGGINPDWVIPGKLTVWILLTHPRGGMDLFVGKYIFSLIRTRVLTQRVGPLSILVILCSGLVREIISVEFSYLSFKLVASC